jgi:hypothetical protein
MGEIQTSFANFLSRAALALPLVLSLSTSGCGADFDEPSEVKTLRVLGVQKSEPYPAPGETVDLTMLWHDPFSKDDARAVERVWLPACFNPPGDLYYSCFADPAWRAMFFPQQQEPGAPPPPSPYQQGDHFSLSVPAAENIVRPPQQPGQPSYGLIYVFFAACKGNIGAEIPTQEGALPIVCHDDDGAVVGQEKFVAGYVSLYVFPNPSDPAHPYFRNQNPAVTGFEVAGKPQPSCIGSGVSGDEPTPCVTEGENGQAPLLDSIDCDDAANADRCFDACKDDGDAACPDIDIKPLIEQSVAERDLVSATFFERDVGEQIWIDYYVDRGSTKSPVRLLNDSMSGWNADFGTKFWAPKEPGPVTLWAVTHDNRGGTNWVRTQVGIRQPKTN